MANPDLRVDAQRTVRRILHSAQTLLARDPDTSMSRIAEDAEVHRTTMARYFPTREALVDQLLSRLLETLDEKVAGAETQFGDPREALRRASLAWLLESQNWRAARYVPLGAVPRNEAANERVRVRMTALFERGQHEGVMRADIAALTLYRAWAGLITVWVAFVPELEPRQLADDIVELLTLPRTDG
jgi:TetR/AcrR family transcriptional regulator, mexCD-oprJ operon repressor